MRKTYIILVLILLTISQLAAGQQTSASWDKWKSLIGEWVGAGNGQPGEGEGRFSFQTDLDGTILVRKSHTAYPETSNSKAFVHDDLLIVYRETEGSPQEAIYFDNEGHTIKYLVNITENSIILTSNKAENTPRFRLSYIIIDNKTVRIDFEMASPQTPEVFKMYLTGNATKVK